MIKKWIIPIAVLFGMLGCSQSLCVKVRGNLASGIQFQFFKHCQDNVPDRHQIYDILIRKLNVSENRWENILYKDKLEMYVSEIRYQEGAFEGIGAKLPLEAGNTYEVIVSEHARMQPVGHGGARFLINEAGLVEDLTPHNRK